RSWCRPCASWAMPPRRPEPSIRRQRPQARIDQPVHVLRGVAEHEPPTPQLDLAGEARDRRHPAHVDEGEVAEAEGDVAVPAERRAQDTLELLDHGAVELADEAEGARLVP